MKRSIVAIDEAACNGCGLCASACLEGAIQMIDGKARLIRDDYCDGLGHCLPSCPTGAISIIEREAAPFDEEAVKQQAPGCAGSMSQDLMDASPAEAPSGDGPAPLSQLRQWPVQIQLAPLSAPYFDGANLLVAADCAAYAHADFHRRFMKHRVTLIGCPKLDPVDYSEKLTEILRRNDILSLSIVRMEVPCCGGLERAALKALQQSGKRIPFQVLTLSTKGELRDD